MDIWVFPCNIRNFDIITHFDTNEYVVWYGPGSVNIDDIVYIYITKPYGEIKFKCVVVENVTDEADIAENNYAIFESNVRKQNTVYRRAYKYVKLKLVSIIPDGTATYDILKYNGLGQIQTIGRVSWELEYFLKTL